MIIPNGTVQFIHTTKEGGVDATTGYPVKSEEKRTCYIPCQFFSNRLNMLSVNNGEAHTTRNFTILLDEDSVPCVAERLELYDARRKSLGQYSVASIEPLPAVCQCKLIV